MSDMYDFSDEDGKIGFIKQQMYDNLSAKEVCKAIEKGVFEDVEEFKNYLDSIRPPEED